jgi:hypothetical protein
MDDLRAMIKAACDEADRVERDYAQWQAQREQLVQRSSATDLVYKIHDDARVQPPQQPDQWADWNAWLDESVMQMFENDFGPAIAKRLSDEAAKLHGQIADLKVEVAALKSEVKTLRSDNVMLGKTNAA